MSTGHPTDPVCENITAALNSRPLGVQGQCVGIDPVCSLITPTTGDQTATPGAPPSR